MNDLQLIKRLLFMGKYSADNQIITCLLPFGPCNFLYCQPSSWWGMKPKGWQCVAWSALSHSSEDNDMWVKRNSGIIICERKLKKLGGGGDRSAWGPLRPLWFSLESTRDWVWGYPMRIQHLIAWAMVSPVPLQLSCTLLSYQARHLHP
jgi:hypothetical protein